MESAAGKNPSDLLDNNSRGIHTISNGNTALGVYGRGWGGYGTIGSTAAEGGGGSRRLHYVELDENFGHEHTRARREARSGSRRAETERGLSFLSDDEGLKRRSRSAVGAPSSAAAAAIGSDYEVEGYLTSGEADVNGLVFGAFEEDRLNLKHFKDKYFLQPATTGKSRNAAEGTGGGRATTTAGKRKSDTQGQHPQQLKSQNTTTTPTASIPKRTQYATLKFNEVNI